MGPIEHVKIGEARGFYPETTVTYERWKTALKRLVSAVRFRPWPPFNDLHISDSSALGSNSVSYLHE